MITSFFTTRSLCQNGWRTGLPATTVVRHENSNIQLAMNRRIIILRFIIMFFLNWSFALYDAQQYGNNCYYE